MAPQNNEQLTMDGAATLLSDGTAPTGEERRPPMDRTTPGRAREQAALEQAWLQASVTVQIDLLGHHVELTLRDSDEGRVLDRLAAVLERFPARRQEAVLSHGKRPEPMPYRILDLLRLHPAGLTRQEIEQALDSSKNLSDTLVGMVRYKRLARVGKGIYALPPD